MVASHWVYYLLFCTSFNQISWEFFMSLSSFWRETREIVEYLYITGSDMGKRDDRRKSVELAKGDGLSAPMGGLAQSSVSYCLPLHLSLCPTTLLTLLLSWSLIANPVSCAVFSTHHTWPSSSISHGWSFPLYSTLYSHSLQDPTLSCYWCCFSSYHKNCSLLTFFLVLLFPW